MALLDLDSGRVAPEETALLRFVTAGSVDDGKSTLIGRLLYDSKAIFNDQLEQVEEVSRRRGDEYTNLALLTDGLRAEREQGITIDVAYRYFATPRRKFVIADCPGHVQYTRNMVTGASTADLAVVLVDARTGPTEQSRRHAFLALLLGIRHLVVCVNKMDLVGWSENAYRSILEAVGEFTSGFAGADITFVPMSALLGDNVVDRSSQMPWYEGPSLLELLEQVPVLSDADRAAAAGTRLPVQYVIRPIAGAHHDYRGYAGRVAGGTFRPGDAVVVLPSGLRTTISALDAHDGQLAEASPSDSVTLRLTDDIDVSRGDMIASVDDPPAVGQEIEADVCWMVDAPLRAGRRYVIKHTTRTARALVVDVIDRLDVNTLARQAGEELALNDIGRVRLRVSVPLVFDSYDRNRTTGSFILVDEATNATAAGGMIRR